MIVVGAFLISIEHVRHTFTLKKTFYIGASAAFLFALRDILMKYMTFSVNQWAALFWMGVGCGITSLLIFLIHHPHIRKKASNGVKHLIGINFLTGLGTMLFLLAISLGSVSIVTALVVGIRPLVVLVAAVFISIFKPKFLNEKLSYSTLFQKLISVVMMIIGVVLIL